MPPWPSLGLVLCLATAAADDPAPLPAHDANAVFRAIRADDPAEIPAPMFADGQSADEQRKALRSLVTSERGVDDLLRDSVTAPFVLKLKDTAADGATIRSGELYFVLHIPLDAVDPTKLNPSADAGPVEAANMRFESRILGPDDLKARGLGEVAPGEWYVHSQSRLLDRIAAESTDHATSSRSAESLIVASRADPKFDDDAPLANRWSRIDPKGVVGPPNPYRGGRGYAKLTALKGTPGAVVVEVHFAFEEPKPWFDGAPILRSKLSLIAQDQIRRLRRELAKKGEPSKP